MNSNFVISIPWRSTGCQYREKSFLFLLDYYSKFAKINIEDSDFNYFNRANARNKCIEKSDTDIVVLVDADNFINMNQILQAVYLCKESNKIIRPFNSIHYLNENATNLFYDNYENFSSHPSYYEYMPPKNITIQNSGGAFVTTKEKWLSLGGMDENFIGWGVEDLAFNEKYRYYCGDQILVDGPNYHLYHPSERIVSEKNWDRYIIFYQSKKIYKEIQCNTY